MKLVINTCFGGFGLSKKAVRRIASLKGLAVFGNTKREQDILLDLEMDLCDRREDSALVQTVYELGKEANGEYAQLKIVEIPDGVDFYIHDYDGVESIHETHRSWS